MSVLGVSKLFGDCFFTHTYIYIYISFFLKTTLPPKQFFAIRNSPGPQILVDGKLLAMQLIADGHANGLRPLENSDIHHLDSYIQRCKQLGLDSWRMGSQWM